MDSMSQNNGERRVHRVARPAGQRVDDRVKVVKDDLASGGSVIDLYRKSKRRLEAEVEAEVEELSDRAHR